MAKLSAFRDAREVECSSPGRWWRHVLSCTLCALGAKAGPTLDARFGTGGLAVLDLGGASASFGAAILQSDGKIVIVGNTPAASELHPVPVPSSDMLVARLNADGSPDATFGDSGVVRIDFAGDEDGARAVVQQPDGKLVVAGWATQGSSVDFAIVRLLPDGTLDADFSGDGKQRVNFRFNPLPTCPLPDVPCLEPTIDVADPRDEATALSLQAGGSLIVSGKTSAAGRKAWTFAGLTASGELDENFGPNHDARLIRYAPPDSLTDLIPSLMRSRNEAIVGATGGFASPYAGILDLTAMPILSLNRLSAQDAILKTMLVQPDGRIVFGGSSLSGGVPTQSPFRYGTWIARTDADARLDASFGANGEFKTNDPSDDDAVLALALEPSGKILSAGYSRTTRAIPTSGVSATVRRFLSNGLPDDAFATGGSWQIDLTGGATDVSSRLQAVLRDANGEIVVAGLRGRTDLSQGHTFLDTTTASIVVARLIGTPTFEMRDEARQVAEGAASPTIEVSRNGATTDAVSVRYVVRAGTAGSGTDFVATTGTLTWSPGEASSRSIPLQLLDDAAFESTETVIVELSEPSEGTITRKATTVSITDDDVAAAPQPAPPVAPSPSSGGGGSTDVVLLLLLASGLAGRTLPRRRRWHSLPGRV